MLRVNIDELQKLQTICEQHDQISLKLNWDMLLNPAEDNRLHLTEYMDGRLIAFLGKYIIGGSMEICGMVHPDFRRLGIFTRLLQDGITREDTVRYSSILLNTPAASVSGQAFLNRVSCRYSFTEYQMQYASAENKLGNVRPGISLRTATPEDAELLSQLDTDGFQDDYEQTLQDYIRLSPQDMADNELILADGHIVGKIRISRLEDRSWIYGFVIHSRYRGKGIGQAVLQQVITREMAAGHTIWLDVAIENPAAMKLYETAGFQLRAAQDYFTYKR
ncbi:MULTISPECIES: GNAT family N-acetyltransferase [unclassified Paenibacillus]|uniref:GNAT family N-acetyltransferase n=1 Tax=unclassified Paenibacillus TaxID=185978 RepID=UPI000837F4B5|nr:MULTISPECIES: GNAT family N-acetyltransferase [unclassified Paenibacillus]NWL87170.1 GNAT family N-acetyltransferase [Paenibacillus sp. 79R4]